MPVRFEAPQPLDPVTSINAGRAQVMQQNMGVLAQMYDRANQLAAQLAQNRQAPVYMGGGGGRGGVVYDGGRDRSGAPLGAVMGLNAEYDRQARKQSQMGREDLLRLQYGLEDDQKRRQEQRLMEVANRLNQPEQNTQQPQFQDETPPEWTPADERDLQYHQNAAKQAHQEYAAGYIDEPQKFEHMAWIDEQRQPLLARKQAAEAYQQKKAQSQAVQMGSHQAALEIARTQSVVANAPMSPAGIPGMLPDKWMPDGRGGIINVNEKKQLELMRAQHTMQDHQIKTEESRVKMQQSEVEHYFKMRESVQQAELKFQNDKMAHEKKQTDAEKSARKYNTREYTSEELEDQVQETMRKMGLPPTPAEFMDQQSARWGRGQRRPAQAPQGPTAAPRQEVPNTPTGQTQAALERIAAHFGNVRVAPTAEPIRPKDAPAIVERRDFSRHK